MHENNFIIIKSEDNILTEGVVKEFTRNNLSITYRNKTKLQKGEKVRINIFDKLNGLFVYDGEIREILGKEIILNNINYIKNFQRRSEVRLDVNANFQINALKKENEEIITLEKPILVNVKNISASGILIRCDLDIPESVSVIIDMNINNKIIKALASIARKYKGKDGYYYGCEFNDLSESEKEHIRTTVVAGQAKLLQKKNL